MRLCTVILESSSSYSQSAQHQAEKLDRESHEDYDERTWREKCTTDSNGVVHIPAMALKQCIDTAAFKLGIKVPGRGRSTFKTFFTSGFLCLEDVALGVPNGKAHDTPIMKEDAQKVTINANADGVRGSGKRVRRRFPVFPKWRGTAKFMITDDIITPDIFEEHVRYAGVIVGIGRFRPEKGGVNGRFQAVKFHWEQMKI